MGNTILSLKNIKKFYPGVIALNGVSMDFEQGEVHAIVGENGAGKSTFIKVISGAIEPDEGVITIESREFSKLNPQLSIENGISVIYQEFNLFDSLSAAENIFFGKKDGKLVDFKSMEKKTEEIFKEFNVNINPKTTIEKMTPAQQQIVEIGKAISTETKVLIMDEPTAPLTVNEVDKLFEIIDKLKKSGITIIYISHRLEEIFKIADRVSVIRDGSYITTKKISETNRKELISLMVGREISDNYPKRSKQPGEIVLEAHHVSGNGIKDASFVLKKGEILGFAGLVGSGRTEFMRLIYGADKLTSGEIILKGKPVKIKSPQQAIKYGIGLIPEDRKTQGCFLDMTIAWNICITNIKSISKYSIVNAQKEKKQAEHFREEIQIKTPAIQQQVKNLSGGNQQKVVLAKVLASKSDIIIFDEPTRGIDVAARAEIYNLMCDLINKGKSIIMISSDMEELLGMSDRIVVISEGKVAGEVQKEDLDQNLILELASGS